MAAAVVILLVCAAYVVIGVIVGVAFVLFGVSKVDRAAIGSGAPWHFRLVILPGAAALWPLILKRWATAVRGNTQERP